MRSLRLNITVLLSVLSILGFYSCDKKADTTPYVLQIPDGFLPMPIPAHNPMTVEGVALGKTLFYDPILSANNAISCASCHAPHASFSDNRRFSEGVNGTLGFRQSMPLINVGWSPTYFWDGRENTLELQVLHPVRDPIEMNLSWPDAVQKLKQSSTYPLLFEQAFGSSEIDSVSVGKALAQFVRTLISGNSKFDRFLRQEIALTPSELRGFDLFRTERADCFHCHSFEGARQFTNFLFMNNGLEGDAQFTDLGRSRVTGLDADRAKFKTPTLRNIALTAPYMHDGRFATLEEVIVHYELGGTASSTIDPLMKNVGTGLNLSNQDRVDLINFLKTLTDSTFITNPEFLP